MSIIEKAAQRLAKVAAKADAPKMQPARSRVRGSTSKDYVSSFSALSDSKFSDKLKKLGIFGSEQQIRRSVDEYRRIKRPLLANAFGLSSKNVDDGSLITVTSALSGEGKTFTSANLALSISRERNNTVLLIDTDSAKAGLSTIFGLESNPGLMDVLAGDSLSIEDTVVRIEELNISIVPAGQHHDDGSELFSSQKMRQITKEIVNRYSDRLVIFDAPPLLLTPEAQIIAGLAGQIVVVVAAVETPKNVVSDALALLDANKPINLILNKTNRSLGINYYGGYYGYS